MVLQQSKLKPGGCIAVRAYTTWAQCNYMHSYKRKARPASKRQSEDRNRWRVGDVNIETKVRGIERLVML